MGFVLASADHVRPDAGVRRIMRAVLAAFYAVAGLFHLARPEPFFAITPDWVPFPHLVILLTGLCEIAGTLALLTARWRRFAGLLLAAYAVCVFPANVKHALEGISLPPVPDSWWYHAPRLAFQPVLVWWALFCAEVIDWPFQASARPPARPKAGA
jgi:uncharacterized membrane protein